MQIFRDFIEALKRIDRSLLFSVIGFLVVYLIAFILFNIVKLFTVVVFVFLLFVGVIMFAAVITEMFSDLFNEIKKHFRDVKSERKFGEDI